jgi:predicted Ser/Thr protein kinase
MSSAAWGDLPSCLASNRRGQYNPEYVTHINSFIYLVIESLPSMEDFTIINQLGEDGKDGVVSLVRFPNSLEAAMKQYKKTKSTKMIQKEVDFQRQAAEAGIAPEIMHVDLPNRRIFMEKMAARVVDELSETDERFERELSEIMFKLDEIGILHNDGNPLNLMFDAEDNLKIIDFGLSNKITKAVRKKWGTPNVKVTLRLLKRGLKKYGIHVK